MRAVFTTNLGDPQALVRTLPEELPERLVVGDRVRFTHSRGHHVDLEVVAVTLLHTAREHPAFRYELHIPSYMNLSIKDWSEWFRKHWYES